MDLRYDGEVTAPQANIELVKCGRRKEQCSNKRHQCRKAGLHCTDICSSCESDYSKKTCENPYEDNESANRGGRLTTMRRKFTHKTGYNLRGGMWGSVGMLHILKRRLLLASLDCAKPFNFVTLPNAGIFID